MAIKKVTSHAPTPERRRFGRVKIAEPRICRFYIPQSREVWTGQGILVNISLGGIHLRFHRHPPIKKSDICYVTFETPDSDTDNSFFRFHVSVVRVEKMQPDYSGFELGLKILSAPIYFSPHEDHQQEVTLLDKTKIMYKYYDLNKKVYNIIVNTSEIRTDKIINIKKIIDKCSYKVNYNKITQQIINDILLENIVS